jgi:hypothetical protein
LSHFLGGNNREFVAIRYLYKRNIGHEHRHACSRRAPEPPGPEPRIRAEAIRTFCSGHSLRVSSNVFQLFAPQTQT